MKTQINEKIEELIEHLEKPRKIRLSNGEIKKTIEDLLSWYIKQKVEEIEGMVEKLADIEHQRWSHWQKYMHSKILPSEHDAIMQIGTEYVERWNRQINTNYAELSEQEKESDRNQVHKYLSLIKANLLSDINKE